MVIDDFERCDLAVDHRDAACCELLGFVVGGLRPGVEEQGQIGRQLPEEQSLVYGEWAAPEDTYCLIADLPAVAVWAVQEVTAPALPYPWNVGAARRPTPWPPAAGER